MSLTVKKTKYEHVVLDERRVPLLAGTNMKLIELVLEKTAYGWSPEELHFQHPYLSLGQIYSALAYYWDHRRRLIKTLKKGSNMSIRFKKRPNRHLSKID
jgi:uncharacterized protein (DUF433 family)